MCNEHSPNVSDFLTAAAPVVSEMLGAEIVFKHENGFLFPDRYTGVVTAYEEDSRGFAWLTVKSPSFNIPLKIHESYLKGYVRSAQILAQAVETQKATA